MHCNTANECFQEINAYCTAAPSGYPLLVNAENYDDFQTILQRMEVDSSKQCVFVSSFSQPDGFPLVEDAIEMIRKPGTYVLAGVSQALMLRDESSLTSMIVELLGLSISGHGVILLSHCERFLERYQQRDPRLNRRIVLLAGEKTPLPQIKLTDSAAVCVGFQPLKGIRGLLAYMEHMDDGKLQIHPSLTVLTHFKPRLFQRSLYSVMEEKGAYDAVCLKYSDLALVKEECGTQEQWNWVLSKTADYKTFSSLICDNFGATDHLTDLLPEVMETGDSDRFWLLWLALKVFGAGYNRYLARVVSCSESADHLEKEIYDEILHVKQDDPLFRTYYVERKRIIDSLPENLQLICDYCDHVGMHGKKAVWYLTSSSENEEYELMKCFSTYNYTDAEIKSVLKEGFPELWRYMQPFAFNTINTKLPHGQEGLRNQLTDYFKNYKRQKLTNRLEEEHLNQVAEFAVTRPYTSLQPRSSIVAKIEKKETGFFFFDALGVEYLSYIQAKCDSYGMMLEISVGCCELPSITSTNKEFEATCPNVRKISDLDDLKHHSTVYDYTVCPYPIHLFRELEIIDRELRKIQAQLAQGGIQKAVILADHGASRLAVLYGKENPGNIKMQEPGVHSGRCCKLDQDPHIPEAAYEGGYAVLANYDRFQGGRRANLEVHGGATLEEVLVPVITLTKKPAQVTYCFVDSVIKFKLGQTCCITLFCNVPMRQPRIQVNGVFYDGTFMEDQKHAQFSMPELKKSNTYDAYIYEGEKNTGVILQFTIERGTKQRNLFGL